MKSETKKTYVVSVVMRMVDGVPYRVDLETIDGLGAMLVARLLKEHDPEVELLERSETIARRQIAADRWPKIRKS